MINQKNNAINADNLVINIKKLENLQDLPLPAYSTLGSAGMDLYAAIPEAITLKSRQRCIVPNGISIALPEGYEAQVRSRSGLALKFGVCVANAPGTVDADYRGEICSIMINHSDEDYVIKPGDRIAQLVIAKHERAAWNIVEELDDTERGSGAFGSTGMNQKVNVKSKPANN